MNLTQNEIIIATNVAIFILMNVMYLVSASHRNKKRIQIYTMITLSNICIGVIANYIFFKLLSNEIAACCSVSYVIAAFICWCIGSLHISQKIEEEEK